MNITRTLIAFLFPALASQVQAFTPTPALPNVPGLLATLEAGRNAEIPRGKHGAMALAAVIRGFSDAGCQFDGEGPRGYAQDIPRFTEALNREMGADGAMSMIFVRTFPNYADTLRYVAERNCESPQVQKTLRNLVGHLRQRFDPSAPPPAAAPAVPAPPPVTGPVTEEDGRRMQRNGCEAARKRLADLQARDRGDARSARMIAGHEASVKRLCEGL